MLCGVAIPIGFAPELSFKKGGARSPSELKNYEYLLDTRTKSSVREATDHSMQELEVFPKLRYQVRTPLARSSWVGGTTDWRSMIMTTPLRGPTN